VAIYDCCPRQLQTAISFQDRETSRSPTTPQLAPRSGPALLADQISLEEGYVSRQAVISLPPACKRPSDLSIFPHVAQ
jgi:hypothetical protein